MSSVQLSRTLLHLIVSEVAGAGGNHTGQHSLRNLHFQCPKAIGSRNAGVSRRGGGSQPPHCSANFGVVQQQVCYHMAPTT